MPLYLGRSVTCPELGVGYITFEEEPTTANTARILEATFETSAVTGSVEVLKEWKLRWGNDGRLVDLPAYRCQVRWGHHEAVGLGLDPEMARQVLAERRRMVA